MKAGTTEMLPAVCAALQDFRKLVFKKKKDFASDTGKVYNKS
jgi:hypothetical protein